MDKLLDLYDWNVRFTFDKDDYACGYADAIGQVIMDIGKILGEDGRPYKFECYKRVMEYTTTEIYWQKYPKPLDDNFPINSANQKLMRRC